MQPHIAAIISAMLGIVAAGFVWVGWSLAELPSPPKAPKATAPEKAKPGDEKV